MDDSTYLVLARRWRPQRFSDLTGQDVVVRTLKNALKQDRLAHAYLLTGIRGVGKTTIARLLAMVVNCEQPDDGEPCGECAACRSIMRGNNLDVQEMDAASHTGVDDIREILDAVRYPPASLKRKVYIIDEAHMLSKSAFNALLKTLEEPPERVMFILATTESEKLPVTVRSRCQRFDLRRLGADEVAHYLAEVMQQEKVAFESEALHEIAVAADGSVRDALSLAERVLAFAGKSLQAGDVRKALGLVGPERARLLADAIFSGDAKSAVETLRAAAAGGHAPRSLLEALGELWHELACLMCDESLLESEPGQTQREWLERWMPCWDAQGLDLRYQVLVGGLRDFGWMDERRAAEMLVMRLAGLHAIYPPAALPDKKTVSGLSGDADAEEAVSGEDVAEGAPPEVVDNPPSDPSPTESHQEEELALDVDDDVPPGLAYGNWEDAVSAYGKLRPGVSAMLEHVLCLDFGVKVRLALDSHQERAIATAERIAFSEWLGRTVHWEPKQGQENAGESIMQSRTREAEVRREHLEQSALNDPHVKQLMEGMDAQLVRVRAPGSAGEGAPE